jgi:hypothetical protein
MGKTKPRKDQRDLQLRPLIIRGCLLKPTLDTFGKEKEITYEAIDDL